MIEGVLGPRCLVWNTITVSNISVVPEAKYEARLRALEWLHFGSKRPSSVRDQQEGVAGWDEREHPT